MRLPDQFSLTQGYHVCCHFSAACNGHVQTPASFSTENAPHLAGLLIMQMPTVGPTDRIFNTLEGDFVRRFGESAVHFFNESQFALCLCGNVFENVKPFFPKPWETTPNCSANKLCVLVE